MTQIILPIDEIVSDPKIRGGRPVLKGTGFKVSDVVINYYNNGYSAEDIADGWGYPLGQVFAALAYYHLHKEEIDSRIKQDNEDAERWIAELEAQGKLTRIEITLDD